MNGMSIAEARRAGMIEEEYDSVAVPQPSAKRNSMFVGDNDDEDEQQQDATTQQSSIPALNPAAPVFSPGNAFAFKPSSDHQPKWMTDFGKQDDRSPDSPGGPPKGLFGLKTTQQEPPVALPAPAHSPISTGLGTTFSPFPATGSGFAGFKFSQPSTEPSLLSGISPAAPEEKPEESASKSASQLNISSLAPQEKAASSEVPRTTPVFTWGKESAGPKIPQPIFNSTSSQHPGSNAKSSCK